MTLIARKGGSRDPHSENVMRLAMQGAEQGLLEASGSD
jgi:hypothetical protein